jgi:hypothetical protein
MPDKELLMKPLKDQATLATLDLTASLTKSNGALPLLLQAVLFFFQEDIGQHRQRPEAYKSCGVHQLIVIQAQLFFPIFEENLNGPACAWYLLFTNAWLPVIVSALNR